MTEINSPTPRRPWLARRIGVALLAGTALTGLAASPMLAAPEPAAQQAPVGPGNPPPQGQPPVNQGQAMPERLPSFVDLVKQVKPAVVSVTNYLKNTASVDENADEPHAPQLPFPFNGSPFGQQTPHNHAVEARGSGFIVNPDGLIITNNHVVKDARRVEVTLDSGEKLTAKVVGTDPRTDIAVLKVETSKALPYLQLGDSKDVQPGQWVIAIGNPFGLSESVSAGIVSAVGRSIGAGPYDQFIQIDAPINQGNSGGPLVTQDGRVVGMNTAILSPSGGSIGIGFAIPSAMIQQVAGDLEKSGHVTRGYLGVEAQPVSEAMSKALGLKTEGGALVAAVQPNTPAAEAGVQPGDVIRTVNGQSIKDPSALAMTVAGIKPGDDVKLGIVRDGRQESIEAHLAELPSEQQVAQQGRSGPQQREGRVGLALGPVSPDLAGQLELPDNTQGAVVTQVKPGSPAEQAGIQPGDVIVGVGTHAIHNPREATRAINDALHNDSNALALRIIRNGQPAFVAVNLSNGDNNSGNG
ncbi:MAG: Do family serine endopeptidase [Acetobacteraceae bacterium]|nr:Do family serine endopeptidase [Acetobacteraceae bacterium]MBV9775644.1 Do family serine endopeptidase [Acetobacteraceae bacterium]